MEQHHDSETVGPVFDWPASDAPHPENLALAAKICSAALPTHLNYKTVVTHFPSGWSSNDVIQVSFSSSRLQECYIVKLPRRHVSPSKSACCKAEAIRTQWAAENGFGPEVLTIDEESGGFAMERIEGNTLDTEAIRQRLPQAVQLLRQIHHSQATAWMRRYNPMKVVNGQLKQVKKLDAMHAKDVLLIRSILRDTATRVKGHPVVPCHNDFHSHNLMLRHACNRFSERLLAIDFEDCNLGDPMWDLAYMAVNLELEQSPDSLGLIYGASKEEMQRVQAYVPLAMAHCATWAGIRGGAWTQHQEELMERLKILMAHYKLAI